MDDAQRIAVLEAQQKNLSSWMEKIDIKIDKIATRLPTWATFLISGLTLLIGWMIRLK